MKILLGGVPFGCDNIGDEAILASVIGLVRGICPDAELVVSTGDRAGTERKFGLKTVPLYGFDPATPADRLAESLDGVDFFIWAGATGLSDYPEMACTLLETARSGGVRTVVWSVGMNDAFNPFFFSLHGKKKRIADAVRSCCGFDLEKRWTERRVRAVRLRLARTLGECSLVVLRDPKSLDVLRRCAPFPDAVAGADTAILQKQCAPEAVPWNSESERDLFRGASARMAVCVSEQNRIREFDKFAGWIDDMLETHPGLLVATVPMNPKKDFLVMEELRRSSKHPDRILPLRFPEPEEVQAVAAECSVIVSSRLHLLILGLNNLVPGVGIARGSKIEYFLSRFGLTTAGTTDALDLPRLTESVEWALAHQDEFRRRAASVRAGLLADLDRAKTLLEQVLASP
ncbi:MAG: polysaccharide pyruvyl transferase family protein [Lentisphaeria bacterium]|nr:polysaccharide pyruvyl transferase family protein [Lentisphaeria bacterium]